MKIFFDTEFTGLYKNTSLISIGCVDENGNTFYAEISDFDESLCDDWIQHNVIGNLRFRKYGSVDTRAADGSWWNFKGPKKAVRKALTEWLNEYDSVEFVSDVCHFDMVLLIDLFEHAFNMPTHVNPACHDINQDIARYYNITETAAFDKSREEILADEYILIKGIKHNALYDALVIKEIHNLINS